MKSEIYHKAILLLVIALMISLLGIQPAGAVTYYGNQLGHDNITWTINCNNNFHTLATSSDGYIRLNDIYFYTTSTNTLTCTLSHFYETTADGEKLCSFTATTTGGTVWFTITGLRTGCHYQILMDSSNIGTPEATSGSIMFNCDSWSTHTFEVFQYEEDTGGGSVPGGGWGEDYIWCYQCQQGNLVYERFPGDSCPDGWSSHPPDCDEIIIPGATASEGVPYDELGFKIVLIIGLIALLVIFGRGKRYKYVVKKMQPKMSIYWIIFILILLGVALYLFG